MSTTTRNKPKLSGSQTKLTTHMTTTAAHTEQNYKRLSYRRIAVTQARPHIATTAVPTTIIEAIYKRKLKEPYDKKEGYKSYGGSRGYEAYGYQVVVWCKGEGHQPKGTKEGAHESKGGGDNEVVVEKKLVDKVVEKSACKIVCVKVQGFLIKNTFLPGKCSQFSLLSLHLGFLI